MFRIRLPNGVEMMFPTAEDFQAAVAGGVVTSDSEIFHQKAERWVPIASHPTYHRAVSAAKSAAAAATSAAPAAPVRRVVPTVPAPAARPAAAEAHPLTAPRPMVAPPVSSSAQRPRLVAEAPAALPAPPLTVSAQRPAIVIPEAAAPPVQPKPVLRVSPPPPPTPPPAPAAPSHELRFIEPVQGLEREAPVRTAAPVKASAPRPVVKAPVAPPAPAASEGLLDLADEFEIIEGFVPEGSGVTMELPTNGAHRHSEAAQHREHHEAASAARNSRPAAAHSEPLTPAPVHPQAPAHHEHAPAPAHAPVKSGGNRWLIAAGLGVALIGGGALVAWRSAAGHPAEAQPAPNAATSAYTPVQHPEITAPTPTPTPPAPAASTTAVPPATKPATAPVAQAPAPTPAPIVKAAAPAPDTSSEILPGRPQSMAVDIDVSGADIGTTVGGGAVAGGAAGISLGTVADHYADAAADAGKQLEARLGQIGFSRLLAPLRFGSVEGMEGARRTISSAVGMVAAYRSRMAALEKTYGDSAARAQRGQKASPKEMLAWDHRLPQRETAEAAQAVDLALTKVDQLYAALLAHPEQVKADANSVTISDPEMSKQYKALQQWLAQRFDSWSGAPTEVVPPTVRQTMRAFSDAIAR